MGVFAAGGIANLPQLLQRLEPPQQRFHFHNRIFRQFTPVDLHATVRVLKKEAIAITLLFFSALGLLPSWICIACAICGIARLVWVLHQANSKVSELQEAGERAGRLIIENDDLKHARDAAVVERNAAERERDQWHHELEIARLDKNRLEERMADARREIEDLTQRLQLEEREHEIQNGEGIDIDEINQGLVRQVEALTHECNLLRIGIQRKDEEIQRMGAESAEDQKERNAALREKERLQRELGAALGQVDAFWQRWQEIEQKRNEQLTEISAIYQRALQDQGDQNMAQLEMIAGKILPDLQKQKDETIGILDEAIQKLPPEHASARGLRKLEGIYKMERDALQSVARVFALPDFIRRIMALHVVRA